MVIEHNPSPKLDQDPHIVEIYSALKEWVLERFMTFNHPLKISLIILRHVAMNVTKEGYEQSLKITLELVLDLMALVSREAPLGVTSLNTIFSFTYYSKLHNALLYLFTIAVISLSSKDV